MAASCFLAVHGMIATLTTSSACSPMLGAHTLLITEASIICGLRQLLMLGMSSGKLFCTAFIYVLTRWCGETAYTPKYSHVPMRGSRKKTWAAHCDSRCGFGRVHACPLSSTWKQAC